MATLDSSIVNIGLPSLTQSLGADIKRIKWVVIVYLVCITSLLLPFGRISDTYGRKRTFQIGFGVFSFASLLCGLSDTLWGLILSRLLQGAGAAMLMANGPAVITACFPPGERGKALGILSMIVSAGLISGPSIGGFLISQLGWQSIFWVNVPIGVLGIYLAQRFITKDLVSKVRLPFDWGGAVLQMVVLLLFMAIVDPPYLAISGEQLVQVPRLLLFGALILSAVIFAQVESEARAPLFDFGLLRNRSFLTGNLASFLTFCSYSALTILMPFYLESVLQHSARETGIFMTMIPVLIFVVAPFAGRISDRYGVVGPAGVGGLLGVLSLLLMGGGIGPGLVVGTTDQWVLLSLALVGMAIGFFQSPNNSAVMSAVPPAKLGLASAVMATFRNLGLVTGTGFATSAFQWHFNESHDFVLSFHWVLLVASGVAALAWVTTLSRLIRIPHRNTKEG
jgi:EmrB/QacA subfamily drug resistance transporter